MIALLLGLLFIVLVGAFGPGDITPRFLIVLALILFVAAGSALFRAPAFMAAELNPDEEGGENK